MLDGGRARIVCPSGAYTAAGNAAHAMLHLPMDQSVFHSEANQTSSCAHGTLRYLLYLLYLLALLAYRERSGWSRPYCRQQDYDDSQLPARQAAISVPCRLLHHLAHHLEPLSPAADSSRGGGGRAEAGGGAGQEQGGGAGGAGGAGGVDFCRGGEWQLVVFIQPPVLNQAVAEGGLVVFFTHAFGMWFI
jgi:hypothetical protein